MILNKTTKASERYHIIRGSQGSAGDPPDWPTHKFEIANGVDRGHGYQGYMSVTYFFTKAYVPEEAKRKCKEFLKQLGYENWLRQQGLL